MAIDYDVITVDLATANANPGLELQVDHEKLIVIQVDADAVFSIDKPCGNVKDEIPAQAASEFCAEQGARIGKIYVKNAAAGAGDELIFVGVSGGNITFFG